MSKTTALWDLISALAIEEGVELFDIEPPKGSNMLRVFIQKTDGNIGVEDCARVSRRITDHSRVEEMLPGDTQLEVSSPGVNRKLKRPEHFKGALGEHVRVKVRNGLGDGSKVLRGTLAAFEKGQVSLKAENGETEEFQLEDVSEANVEYRF